MASIEFRGVTKRYPDGHEAVRELSLEIPDGELMVFVGPSGCGKTTALRMVAGLEDITGGELYIGERLVNDLVPKQRDIAMVFQSYALYPHMSVRQNIGFALKLAGTDPAELDRRVREAADILDLETHLDRRPAQLSGGQRQRVAMGRAIVREPAAFLMDEPLSNLDAKLRVTMRGQVARLQRSLGTTTIYVTHDQVEAMTLGQRVAVMRQGVLEQVDAPMDIYLNPSNVFVATFIGSPAMNLFDGEVVDGAIHTPVGTVPIDERLERRISGLRTREVIVGIRPESFGEADDESSVVFDVDVEMLEAVGSDMYVHFTNPSQLAGLELEREEAEEAGVPERPTSSAAPAPLAIARVSPFSRIGAGTRARLAVDPGRIHLFEAGTGASVTDAALPEDVLA